jgi:hypothetical protein
MHIYTYIVTNERGVEAAKELKAKRELLSGY